MRIKLHSELDIAKVADGGESGSEMPKSAVELWGDDGFLTGWGPAVVMETEVRGHKRHWISLSTAQDMCDISRDQGMEDQRNKVKIFLKEELGMGS